MQNRDRGKLSSKPDRSLNQWQPCSIVSQIPIFWTGMRRYLLSAHASPQKASADRRDAPNNAPLRITCSVIRLSAPTSSQQTIRRHAARDATFRSCSEFCALHSQARPSAADRAHCTAPGRAPPHRLSAPPPATLRRTPALGTPGRRATGRAPATRHRSLLCPRGRPPSRALVPESMRGRPFGPAPPPNERAARRLAERATSSGQGLAIHGLF